MFERNTDFSKGIPFTQLLLPDGRRMPQWIERPADVTAKAQRIIDAGFGFEVEQLSDGISVSLTITADDCDHAIELCKNGVQVPAAVDRLIMGFTNVPEPEEVD